MANNRYIGDYPVIGIRPTIDGRRGPLKVREGLEDQTMAMAQAAKKLFEENLCYSNGEPVKVVIADTTIGRVAEAAACANKFRKEGVDITLTVTPCWCYGSETMDMDPQTIKGVWGFNGTERPGAVYLASVLASHAQKGLPAFGIYGHDVQNLDEVTDMPADVQEKLLRFGRAAVAVATMRGKSYLQIGSICMGIGGSIIDSDFIESYLGMRVESVDEVEVIRRMSEGIYDEAEFRKALAWTKENAKIGFDKNPEDMQRDAARKEEDLEFVVKMMCIIKDLMNGNPNLPEGREEEMVGHNAIAAGFQGQRQWTDFYPNCDFPEAMLNTSFDWNGAREPYILATENDVLNGLGMLFMKLLTNRAQMFADVRTYWSVEACERASGYKVDGKALENGGFIHLINSGATALDACGECKDENGDGIKARFVGGSMDYDIAVLEIQGSKILKESLAEEATFGDSNNATVGEKVHVVGNPQGHGMAVSEGVLSVDSEYIGMKSLDGANRTVSYRVMRTDAAVNGGNSGGPLFNSRGELIAIVNAKSIADGVENVGYALPAAQVQGVMENVKNNNGNVSRATLGVSVIIADTTVLMKADGTLLLTEKIQIDSVTKNSAAYGKLLAGDVMKTMILDGVSYPLNRRFYVNDLLLKVQKGDTVSWMIERNGKEMKVEITFNKDYMFTAVQ